MGAKTRRTAVIAAFQSDQPANEQGAEQPQCDFPMDGVEQVLNAAHDTPSGSGHAADDWAETSIKPDIRLGQCSFCFFIRTFLSPLAGEPQWRVLPGKNSPDAIRNHSLSSRFAQSGDCAVTAARLHCAVRLVTVLGSIETQLK